MKLPESISIAIMTIITIRATIPNQISNSYLAMALLNGISLKKNIIAILFFRGISIATITIFWFHALNIIKHYKYYTLL